MTIPANTGDRHKGSFREPATADTTNTLTRQATKVENTVLEPIPINDVSPIGIDKTSQAIVTGVIGVDVTITVITITPDATLGTLEAKASATSIVLWSLVKHDDGVNTILVTSVGLTFDFKSDILSVTAGSSGVQELRLIGNEVQQPATELHGFLAGNEE